MVNPRGPLRLPPTPHLTVLKCWTKEIHFGADAVIAKQFLDECSAIRKIC